jgi:hypothetical protein
MLLVGIRRAVRNMVADALATITFVLVLFFLWWGPK